MMQMKIFHLLMYKVTFRDEIILLPNEILCHQMVN